LFSRSRLLYVACEHVSRIFARGTAAAEGGIARINDQLQLAQPAITLVWSALSSWASDLTTHDCRCGRGYHALRRRVHPRARGLRVEWIVIRTIGDAQELARALPSSRSALGL
jgi:hypothetical protein